MSMAKLDSIDDRVGFTSLAVRERGHLRSYSITICVQDLTPLSKSTSSLPSVHAFAESPS